MSLNCPPTPQASTCSHGGCIPDFSQPSAKICCSGSGGGNMPNGPLIPCIDCPGPTFPEDCRNVCNLSPLARIIATIVRLADNDGVSNDEILQEHNDVVCPQKPLTIDQVTAQINIGVQRGALRRTASGRVRVYGFFGQLPSNLSLFKELGVYYQLCLGLFCNNGR